jgi:hypothetical protein
MTHEFFTCEECGSRRLLLTTDGKFCLSCGKSMLGSSSHSAPVGAFDVRLPRPPKVPSIPFDLHRTLRCSGCFELGARCRRGLVSACSYKNARGQQRCCPLCTCHDREP